MHIHLMKFFPENGAGPQVRAVLEKRLETIGKTGKRGSIRNQVAFGDDGPTLEMSVINDSLADFQAHREFNRANPILNELKDYLRKPPSNSLTETFVMPDPDNRLEAPYFAQRATVIPKFGHNGELQPLLQERAVKQNEKGVRTVFGHVIYGRKPRGFVLATQLQDLNALEEYRNELRTDESFRQLARNLREIALAVEYELWEIVTTTL
ncbi:hypothetical protein M1N17_00680 [Dehalococcoidia bacterium]|nr:hypothetical protein [Dehalococcoidia bacterium]